MKLETKVKKAMLDYQQAIKDLKKGQISLMKSVDECGLKKIFIIDKMRMKRGTFFFKQRTQTFTIEEMKQIIEIID